MSSEIKKLKKDKGAIFLETALVMPIFMILLCFSIDLPRIMSAKQRLIGASRLVAEIRARNNGSCAMTGEDIKPYFFTSNSASRIQLHVNSVTDQPSLMGGIVTTVNNWMHKILVGPLSFLPDIITGGNIKPYFTNVFSKDIFFGGNVSATVPTILPAEAYTNFAGGNAPETQIEGTTVYMPGCDSCKYTGVSFIDDLVNFIHNL